jgi:HEAT repeat protein
MTLDLNAESIRLRELGRRPPTPEARVAVLQALQSKFEGIQSVAADVLATWGDESSKKALRHWVHDTAARPNGWAIHSVAVRALSRLLTASDTTWVLDLYFSASDGLLQHRLVPLAAALPAVPAKEQVMSKAGDPNPRIRHAATKVLVRSSWGEPKELLRPFRADSDAMVRKLLIAWGAA